MGSVECIREFLRNVAAFHAALGTCGEEVLTQKFALRFLERVVLAEERERFRMSRFEADVHAVEAQAAKLLQFLVRLARDALDGGIGSDRLDLGEDLDDLLADGLKA